MVVVVVVVVGLVMLMVNKVHSKQHLFYRNDA